MLLATVAFHCIAVADTVYSVAGEEPAARPDRATEEAQVEAEFAQGMYALIVGALAVLEQREPFDQRCSRRGNRPGAMKNAARIAPGGVLRSLGQLSPGGWSLRPGGSRTAS